MRTSILLPELGASPIRLSLWYSLPGEMVFAGDRVLEVVVAGATFDVSAPANGRLIERCAWPRDVLTPGQVLGVMECDPEYTV